MRQVLPEFFENKSLIWILMMNFLARNKAYMAITTLKEGKARKINSNSSSSSVIDKEDKGSNGDKKIKYFV